MRPARTIVTRSQSASTSERTWLDSRTVLPAAWRLAHALLEDGGHERVESRRRLVQEVQLGAGGEGRDERDLLAVALRVGAALLGRVEPEPLDQRVPARPVQPAAQGTEQVDHLAAGEVGPQADLTGARTRGAGEGRRVAPRVEAEDGDAAAVLVAAAQKDAERRRLAGSVRVPGSRAPRRPPPAGRAGREPGGGRTSCSAPQSISLQSCCPPHSLGVSCTHKCMTYTQSVKYTGVGKHPIGGRA